MTSPALIAVDIGNSFAKIQVSSSAGLLREAPSPVRLATEILVAGEGQHAVLDTFLSKAEWAAPARWIVATVHGAAERMLREWVREHRPADAYHRLLPGDVPLSVEVRYPQRVGMDRLLSALAATRLRSAGCPIVVIDAGSAVTVDAVTSDDRFLGGAILPGLRMASAALSHAADQLPPAGSDFQEQPDVIGISTEEAIRSGVFWGTLGAVREIRDRMVDLLERRVGLANGPLNQSGRENAVRVFITGGDATCLQDLDDHRTEFHPDLVLTGIRLLQSHLPTELSPP